MTGTTGRKPWHVLRGCTTIAAALFLFAAPGIAHAQWWEDEEAFGIADEEGLTEYGYYDDYGLGTDEGYYGNGFYGDDEVAIGEEDGIVGEDAGLQQEDLNDDDLYGDGYTDYGYYEEDFENDTGWLDWF